MLAALAILSNHSAAVQPAAGSSAAEVLRGPFKFPGPAPRVGPLEMGMSPRNLPKAFTRLKPVADPKLWPYEGEIGVYVCDKPQQAKGFPEYADSVLAYFAGDRLYKVVYKVKLAHSDLSPRMLAKLNLPANTPKSACDRTEEQIKADLARVYSSDRKPFVDLLDFRFTSAPGLTPAKLATLRASLVAAGVAESAVNAFEVPGGLKMPEGYVESGGDGTSYWRTFRGEGLFAALQGQKWVTSGKAGDADGTISTRLLLVHHIWTPLVDHFGADYATAKRDDARAGGKVAPAAKMPGDWVRLSEEFYRNKDYAKAIEACDAALRLDPKSAPAYAHRGHARHGKGDAAGAVADADEALRLDPKYEFGYYVRGQSQDDPAKAVADLTRVVELNPKNRAAYYLRGHAHRKAGDLQKAVADYTTVVELDPKYAIAYFHRAGAYQALGDQARAKADQAKAVSLNPNLAKRKLP